MEVAPPTRGWTQALALGCRRFFGCPAYAGMDPSAKTRRIAHDGLPRLRGDGP